MNNHYTNSIMTNADEVKYLLKFRIFSYYYAEADKITPEVLRTPSGSADHWVAIIIENTKFNY
jgi:hypothetical protein